MYLHLGFVIAPALWFGFPEGLRGLLIWGLLWAAGPPLPFLDFDFPVFGLALWFSGLLGW